MLNVNSDSNQIQPRHNWFHANPRKARWLLLLLCLLIVELLSRGLVGAGLLNHVTYPTNERPVFWAYIDPVVGIWHYPSTTFHHKTDCIDQIYTTNSAGARDPERSQKSAATQRVVVLGDSMVEGFGVADGKRMTDILEASTGIEHLNFGVAGSFGTVQEWLFYHEHASRYEHSDVFLFVLPANDFRDNDPEEFSKRIYRPYLRPTGDSFEVWYPVEFAEREDFKRPLTTVIKNSFDNNFYILNVLRQGISALKDRSAANNPADTITSYDKFSANDLAVLTYTLNEIVTSAGDRNVYLFTIPDDGDIEFARQYGYDFDLVDQFKALAAQHPNVRYLDLLPGMLSYTATTDRPFRDLTLGCDPHWSELGNEVVAQLVYDFVYAAARQDN